jgi:outer membrane immunogenic protein
MSKTAVVAAIALGLLAARSMAADLPMGAPTYKAPVVAPAPFTWTGFYVGGNVGYGWGQVKPGTINFYQPANTFVGSISGINYDISGVIGGLQTGYNWQYNNMVFGLEADFSGTGIDGNVTDPVNNYKVTSQIEWLATVRGRFGVTFGRIFPYLTGGLAIGQVKTTLDDYYATTITSKDSNTYIGWTVGGGVEVPVAPHWSVKAEYLYVDLGSKGYSFSEPSPPGWPRIAGNASVTTSIARIGANYRF